MTASGTYDKHKKWAIGKIHHHAYNKHKKGQHTSTAILENHTITIHTTKIRKANTTHEHGHFGKILMDWKSQTTTNIKLLAT